MATRDDAAPAALRTQASHPIDPFVQGRPPAEQIAKARVSLTAFASAAGGIVAAWSAPETPAWVWFSLAAGGGLLALVAPLQWLRAVGLAAAVALLAAGWLAHRALEIPPRSLERLLREEPAPLRIEGVVEDAPRIEPAARGEFAPYSYQAGVLVTRFILRASQTRDIGSDAPASGEAATGALWARVDAPMPQLRAGDRIAVEGLVRAITPPTNPGQRDARPWARQRGIAGSIYAPEAALVQRLEPDSGFSVRRAVARFRGALRTRASRAIDAVAERMESPDAQALLRALILGDRGEQLRDVQDAARQAGLSHMLAISGLHIGALAYLLLLALRLTGDRGALEPVAVALLIGLYLFALPARTPALRAGIMVLTFLGAELAGRRYSRLAVLALSALLVLLWRPMELFAVGFQLSYAIVAGLILFAPWFDARFPGRRPLLAPARRSRRQSLSRRAAELTAGVGRFLRTTFIVSLCATLMALPIKSFHMAMLAPLGPITTTIAMPFLVAALAVGGGALLIGMIAPALVGWMALLAWLALGPMLALMFAVDAIPFAFWRIPSMSLPWSIAAFALIGSAFWSRGGPSKRSLLTAASAFAVWTAVALSGAGRLPASVVLRVDMLDVGDGACLVLRSRSQAMLWDCGSSSPTIGRYALPRALRELGVWRVDRAVVTHADMDHYSALPDLTRAIGLERVHITNAFRADAEADPGGPDAHLLSALARRGVETRVIAAGDELQLGEVHLRFLWPPPDASSSAFRVDNESSLVALVSVPTRPGERRLLLTGDLEGAGVRALRQAHPRLSAHVMELPHHGGFRPESLAFVQAVDPQVVMQSTGPSRLGDERWAQARAGRTWRITAAQGAIAVEFLRDGDIRTASIIDADD